MCIHLLRHRVFIQFLLFCGHPITLRDKCSALFGSNSVLWWKLEWPVSGCRLGRWYMEALCCPDMASFLAVPKENAEVAGKLSMVTVHRLRGSTYCLLSGFGSIGFSAFGYEHRAAEVKNQDFPSLRWSTFLGFRALSDRCSWLWSVSCPASHILLLEATSSINFFIMFFKLVVLCNQ